MFLQRSLDFFACILTEHNKQSTAHWLPLSSTAILPDSYHFLNKAWLLLLLNFDPRSSLSLGVLIPLALPGLSLLVFEGPPKIFFLLRNSSYNITFTTLTCKIQWFFSTSTMLCNHHHYQNTLVTQKRNPVSISGYFLLPLSPSSWQPLLSVCMDFSILGISYQWNHIICSLLWLTCFT